MGIEQNKQLVADFMAAFSKKDNVKEWSAFMDDSATWWIIGKPDRFSAAGTKTKAEFVDLIESLSAVVPEGIQLVPKKMIAEGDAVAVEAVSFADTTTGKRYENQYHILMEIRDNRIQAVREYLDPMHAKEILMEP
jgi:ketosteroid isomerase-like protein